jgi:uncharacterized protein (TIGR02391 family)
VARSLEELLPPPETLLTMQPEEIAGFLLEYLHELPQADHMMHLRNVTGDLGPFRTYARQHYQEAAQAVAEAWAWLLREGMIAQRPNADHGFAFVTRRGKTFRTRGQLEAYRRASVLQDDLLDGSLAQKVVPVFRRGDYDTAVFTAFKEVEVRVRDAAGYSHGEIGVALMQKAFHPDTGSLTDKTKEGGERQAMMFLFAGAIGMFKNPSSHRNVEFQATEASALIQFANYLLAVVEERRAGT